MAHQDNILVWRKDGKEHDYRNFLKISSRVEQDKSEFRVTQTIFLGEVLTDQGIQPDMQKVKSITEIGAPSNVTELQSILGMINFFSKFVPDLAAKTKSMRCLHSKHSVWSWDANHQKEVDNVNDQTLINLINFQQIPPRKD